MRTEDYKYTIFGILFWVIPIGSLALLSSLGRPDLAMLLSKAFGGIILLMFFIVAWCKSINKTQKCISILVFLGLLLIGWSHQQSVSHMTDDQYEKWSQQVEPPDNGWDLDD